jgi:hypothetical protein
LCNLPIAVLFQHPSPSTEPKSINAISTAVKDCMTALDTKIVYFVHFIYDYHELNNSWTYLTLSKYCFTKNGGKYMMVTNLMEKSCEKGQIRMKLPCLT